MTRVSVIVPIYNKAKYLKRCLNSLVNQTVKDAQVILVDDGSTDGSLAIAKQYAKDNGWELYKITHGGVSKARNYGLKKTTGDYITFLDADDAWMPEAIEKILNMTKDDKWLDGLKWLANELDFHYKSKTFKRFGFSQKKRGKYDIVYFVKNCTSDEELRYSLRSVEENCRYKDVWFYGGCPSGIEPDYHVKCVQKSPTKWQNVRNMMREACLNDDITENFWLFNDDFFILKPMDEKTIAYYDGTITTKAEEIKAKHGGQSSEWSRNLLKLRKRLADAGKSELCYAVHAPMLVNRKKMLEVLELYPDEPMVRALYGNWWEVEGKQLKDPKCSSPQNRDISKTIASMKFLSTSDESFRSGYVGMWLRDRFPNKSRFEE